MKKTILALLLAGATFVTGCGDSNSFDGVSGQQGNPQPIITPTTTPTPTTGYFVDAATGNDATGNVSTGAPYATIQAAATAAPASAVVTVRAGTYNEVVTLKNGQQLLGVASGNRPVITGPIVLGDGNTLDYLRVQGTNGSAIDGDDQNGGTITNCEIANTTNFGSGVKADSATGTWIVEGNMMTSLAGAGVEVSANTGDVMVIQVNGNTITGSAFTSIGLQVVTTGVMRVQANDNVLAGNGPFQVLIGDSAEFVAQIVGNTNDATYLLSRLDLTSHLRIERYAQLTTLNSGGATVDEDFEPVEDVANGAAGFGTAP